MKSWWAGNKTDDSKTSTFVFFLWAGPFAIFVAIVVSIVLAFQFLTVSRDGNRPTYAPVNSLAYPASVDATLKQCGATFDLSIEPDRYGEIPNGYKGDVPRHDYIVPAFGYFSNHHVTPKKVYTAKDVPSYPDVIRILRDGNVIVWYTPSGTEDKAPDFIRDYANKHEKTIAMPWTQELSASSHRGQARELPSKRAIAFSAWGITQSCGFWDGKVADDFQEFVAEHQDIEGATPMKVGDLDAEGNLLPIAYSERE